MAKLNKDTNQWMEAAMGAGGGGYEEIYGIATHNDSLYLAAYCEGAANFGSISDTTPNTYGFIAKLNKTDLTCTHLLGMINSWVYDISTSNNQVHATGEFWETASFETIQLTVTATVNGVVINTTV